MCAVCALRRLLDRTPEWARNGILGPLCCDSSGAQVKYERYMRLLHDMMVRLGYRMHDERGKAIFGSHSCRRGGAQSLARAGYSLRFIALWGRWESECVRLYVEQAELDGSTGEVGRAMMADTTVESMESQWNWATAVHAQRTAQHARRR